MMPGSDPELSVVVTIVEAGAALERCLTALSKQDADTSIEILVPYDGTQEAVSALALRFPGCRFLALGALPTTHPPHSASGQHELYDRRRAAGLAAASGKLIAIIEDRGAPEFDWARRFLALHDALEYAVIGGAVASDDRSLLCRAAFLCDFARYQRPFRPGIRDFVTDINVCYKRAALLRMRALWEDRFHETTVHWALQRAGYRLYLSPEPLVRQQRARASWRGLLGERFAWGRLFAVTRARESARSARLLRAALCPLLPLVLYGRILARLAARRGGALTAAAATPALLCLLAAWAAGEAAGYVTGRD